MPGIIKELNTYRGMTVRNIKVYAKDRLAVLLSMLTQIIILGLYILFLKDMYTGSVYDSLGALQDIITRADIDTLVNSWLVAGVVGTSVVTVALNTLSVMVGDKQEKIDYDYNATSVKGRTVVFSYLSGAVATTFIMSSILLTAGLVFLHLDGGISFEAGEVAKIYGLVLLGSLSSTLVLMAFVSFFRKSSTLSSFGIMVSAAIGFVIGAYIPVSEFSKNVQTAVNLVPGSQIAGAMRNVLMNPALEKINSALGGVDGGQFVDNAKELFAVNLNIFDFSAGMRFMMMYSAAAVAVFLVINIVLYRFSSKRK